MAHRQALSQITTPSSHRFVSGPGGVHIRAGQEVSYRKGLRWINQDPVTAATFGASVDFSIPSSWLLRSVYAEINLAAVTATYTGGGSYTIAWDTSKGPIDMISRVEIYGNGGATLLQTIQRKDLEFLRDYSQSPAQEAVYLATGTADGTAAAQQLFIHIPSFIDTSGGIPLFALTGQLRIRLHFDSFDYTKLCTVTGGPSTVTITSGSTLGSVKLRLLVEEEISSADKTSLTAAINSAPKLFRVLLPRTQQFAMAASATGITTLLSGVTGPVAWITLRIVNDTTLADVSMTSYLLNDSTGASISGPACPESLNRLQASVFWPSDNVAATKVGFINFAESPLTTLAKGSNTGHFDMTGSEQLVVVTGSLANPSTLHVTYWSYGFIELYQGDIKVHA